MSSIPLDGSMNPDEVSVRALFDRVRNAWNRRDAEVVAAAFCDDADMVGFDGSELKGRERIASFHRRIFANRDTGKWVGLVRSVRFPAPDVAVAQAASGWFLSDAAGRSSIAVQSFVAVRLDDGWRLLFLQSTPAQYHGRPDEAAALAEELRRLANQ